MRLNIFKDLPNTYQIQFYHFVCACYSIVINMLAIPGGTTKKITIPGSLSPNAMGFVRPL